MPLRVHFQERLEEIRNDVLRMGGEAADMVRRAVDATLNGDQELARRVIESDDRIDQFERSAVNKAVVAVMQEAPVAGDLRFLVSTLGIVGEIEKVGDHAVKLCRRATRLHGPFPADLRRQLAEIGEMSQRNFGSALRLYVEYSDELASEIIQGDKEVDQAYTAARACVFELIRQNPAQTDSLVQTIEAFHALEHVADHAVAIAVRLRMLYTAEQGD